MTSQDSENAPVEDIIFCQVSLLFHLCLSACALLPRPEHFKDTWLFPTWWVFFGEMMWIAPTWACSFEAPSNWSLDLHWIKFHQIPNRIWKDSIFIYASTAWCPIWHRTWCHHRMNNSGFEREAPLDYPRWAGEDEEGAMHKHCLPCTWVWKNVKI